MTIPGSYPEASQATSALIWSIVGLVCCPPTAIVGYIQGKGELTAIATGQRDPANQGTANAARIIAIVVLVVNLVAIAGFAVLVASGVGLAFISDAVESSGF